MGCTQAQGVGTCLAGFELKHEALTQAQQCNLCFLPSKPAGQIKLRRLLLCLLLCAPDAAQHNICQ